MEEKNTQPGENEAVNNQTRTPIEQVVDTARDQAGMAAEAIRRGEFIRE